MKIISESHVHDGINPSWIEALPASEEFKISVHESEFEGLDHCVKTDESSEIYWEKRGDRPNFSRMVKASAVKTNKVVTVEVPHNGEIVLATAYFGRKVADKEPFDSDWSIAQCEEWVRNNPDSFWANHALVKE